MCFDSGCELTKTAVVRNREDGGQDMVLTEEGARKTPLAVSFPQNTPRKFGDQAALLHFYQ
jgi:hypothetical protein